MLHSNTQSPLPCCDLLLFLYDVYLHCKNNESKAQGPDSVLLYTFGNQSGDMII